MVETKKVEKKWQDLVKWGEMDEEDKNKMEFIEHLDLMEEKMNKILDSQSSENEDTKIIK